MSSIFSIFEQYGWPGLLTIILIGIVWFLLRKSRNDFKDDITKGISDIATSITDSISKQNDVLIKTMQEQNTQLINHIIENKQHDKEIHDEMISQKMELSSEINSNLLTVLNVNNADRVGVIEFHNSYNNLLGVPFAKYSIQYEQTKRGAYIEPLSTKCSNMPFSTISGIVDDIYHSDGWQIKYENINDIEVKSSTLYYLLNEVGAKALIFNAMYDTNNKMIGILFLEYHHEIPNHINYDELKIDTAQITSIINLRYKYNKND